MTDSSRTATTRRAWHGVAELVLAGPQYRLTGTIRLRVIPGGFATIREPQVSVVGIEVAGETDRLPIDGRTCAELAQALGLRGGAPEGLYRDGSGVGLDEVLTLDPDAAILLASALATGQAALLALAPAESPVLWPEHFDLGISTEEVNYGVSLGDGYINEPYAYVGPWQPRQGPFWNAPFGAARPLREFDGTPAVTEFLAEGRALAAVAPGPG